jgi:hypothetical protein
MVYNDLHFVQSIAIYKLLSIFSNSKQANPQPDLKDRELLKWNQKHKSL